MTNLHPIFEQVTRNWIAVSSIVPAMKIGDASRPKDPFSGLYSFEYITPGGLVIRCYLEYEAEHDGGTGTNSEESWPERMDLFHAFVGTIDISEVLEGSDLKKEIEQKALKQMKREQDERGAP